MRTDGAAGRLRRRAPAHRRLRRVRPARPAGPRGGARPDRPDGTGAACSGSPRASQLKGKGGAGFPFARKLRAVLESCERQDLAAVVVVNATEGEPASWKDKVLLTRAPHLILDGAALAAYALDAEEIVIGVADDGVGRDSLTEALAERRMPVPTTIVTVPHRFISGEGGALVNGINGLPHIPPGTKKRSSDSGRQRPAHPAVQRRDVRPAGRRRPARPVRVRGARHRRRAGHRAAHRDRRGGADRPWWSAPPAPRCATSSTCARCRTGRAS